MSATVQPDRTADSTHAGNHRHPVTDLLVFGVAAGLSALFVLYGALPSGAGRLGA